MNNFIHVIHIYTMAHRIICLSSSSLLPLTDNTPFHYNQWGVVLEGASTAARPVYDSLTCTLIGSSRNLLSWMLCAGIGSSLQTQRK